MTLYARLRKRGNNYYSKNNTIMKKQNQPESKLDNIGIGIKQQGKEVITVHKEYFELPIPKKEDILNLLRNWVNSELKELEHVKNRLRRSQEK